MSDRIMDLIRGANPYPGGLPPLPIEPVLRRLNADGSRRPAARRQIPLPNIGGVVAALSAVAALAVAVLAIATLGHRHRVTVSGRSTVRSSSQELLRTLAVLRRPQTEADLMAAGRELPLVFLNLRLDKPLVRAVKLGKGYGAAIYPTRIAQAQRGEGVVLALRGPGLSIITSVKPTSTQALRDHGLLLSDYVASGVDRGVILVPDGVAQITLDRFRLLAPRKASLGQVPPTTSTVSDNVSLLQITGLTERNLHLNPHALGRYITQRVTQSSGHRCQTTLVVYSLPATARMTWLSPAHTPIRRLTINLRLAIGIQHPVAGTVRLGPAARAACQRIDSAP